MPSCACHHAGRFLNLLYSLSFFAATFHRIRRGTRSMQSVAAAASFHASASAVNGFSMQGPKRHARRSIQAFPWPAPGCSCMGLAGMCGFRIPFPQVFSLQTEALNACQYAPSHRNLPEKGTHAAAACILSACDTVAFIIACVTSGENDASSLMGYFLFSRSAAALFRRRQRHCRTVRHGGVSLRSDSKMPFTAACCARAEPRGYGRWSGA